MNNATSRPLDLFSWARVNALHRRQEPADTKLRDNQNNKPGHVPKCPGFYVS